MDDLDYLLKMDFHLLKVSKKDKNPATANGVYDARSDWKKPELKNCNIGLAGGHGYTILDFDDLQYLEDVEQTYGRLTAPCWKTIRGRYHYLFRGDVRKFAIKAGEHHCCDVIGRGGYGIIPPSSYDTDKYKGSYEWIAKPWETDIPPLPQWVLELAKPKATKSAELLPSELTDDELKEVEDDLKLLSPNMSYMDWIQVGMALKSTRHPDAFRVWDEWSSKGEKYKPDEMKDKWGSFRRRAGDMITINTLRMMTTKERHKVTELRIVPKAVEPKAKIEIPMPPAGLLKELTEEYLRKAFIPHKEFALGAALSVMSTLTQRSVRLPTGTKTSSFIALIGPAACGKNDYLVFARETIRAINPEALLGDSRSTEALKRELSEYPSRLLSRDEWFDNIDRAYGPRRDNNSYAFSSLLLDVYGNKPVLEGSSVKDTKQCIKEIKGARLCVLGLSTVKKLQSLLRNPDFAESGMLSRLDMFIASGKIGDGFRRRESHEDFRLDKDTYVGLKNLRGKLHSPMSIADGAQSIGTLNHQMVTSPEAHEYLDSCCYQQVKTIKDENAAANWSRMCERIERYAASHSIGCDRGGIITMEDAEWAVALGKAQYQRFCELMELSPMSEYESIANAVMEYFDKGVIKTRSDIAKYCRKYKNAQKNVRDQVFEDLLACNRIALDESGASRRSDSVRLKLP